MSRLFNLDNPIWNILNRITDVLILSLLFIVTSIPVITIGTALTSLYYTMFRMVDNTEGPVIQCYFRQFKKNFRLATPVWIVFLLIGAIITGDIYIIGMMAQKAKAFFMPVMIVISALYVIMFTYIFPFLARLDLTVKKTIYMAFMISIKEFPRTLFMLFITGIMICVGVFVSAPFFALAPGVISFSNAILMKEIFKKYGYYKDTEAENMTE